MKHPKVRFQGNEYLLIGDLESGGPIATQGAYENGEVSYAHLGCDGVIRRYCQEIGTKDDLEFIGESDTKLTDDAFANILIHPSWPPLL